MEKEKLIRRIKNLLDMADDVSSPNEAFIAAKRARKLMDNHQISRDEIKEYNANSFGTARGKYEYRSYPRWMGCLGVDVARLNDCQSVWGISPDSGAKYEQFRGFKSDVIISKYMFEYLVGRARDLCHKRKIIKPSLKNFYFKGFQIAISKKVSEELERRRTCISVSGGKGLVVVKSQLIEQHFGAVEYLEAPRFRAPTHEELIAAQQGSDDGLKTGLDHQVSRTHAEEIAG